MFKQLDFSPGIVVFDDFNLNVDLPLDEDNDDLKEDMFQVEYPNDYIIDLGWYSGIKQFIVYIIKDCNWEEPIEKIKCQTIEGLDNYVQLCIDKVRELLSKEGKKEA
jgi:hypothetical protein